MLGQQPRDISAERLNSAEHVGSAELEDSEAHNLIFYSPVLPLSRATRVPPPIAHSRHSLIQLSALSERNVVHTYD